MSNLKGLRYVAIYRCSTNVQTEKSIPDQQLIVQAFAVRNEIKHAGGDVIQAGISATKHRQRDDILQLIERKRVYDDFDIIIVHDFSRLTRRGAEDAADINKTLRKDRLKVISATEEVPDGVMKPVIEAVYHPQHNQYVRTHALRVATGQMSSIKAENSVGARGWSFGIDRKYVSYSGHENHILRALPDGS